MKHIAAYALLVLGGKSNPTPEEVAKVVREAGINPDTNKCIALCTALKGKKFEELIEAGIKTLESMPIAAPVYIKAEPA